MLINECFWPSWIAPWRRMKANLYLQACIKINWKGIKDLNIRPKTLNVRVKLQDLNKIKCFLNRTAVAVIGK